MTLIENFTKPYGLVDKIDAIGYLDSLKNNPDAPRKQGKVVLVTADTPLKASRGEGKTTTTIALIDALNERGIDAAAVLQVGGIAARLKPNILFAEQPRGQDAGLAISRELVLAVNIQCHHGLEGLRVELDRLHTSHGDTRAAHRGPGLQAAGVREDRGDFIGLLPDIQRQHVAGLQCHKEKRDHSEDHE